MIEEFKKEVAARIVKFCITKAEKYDIDEEMQNFAILGCSTTIINELKKESAHLIGLIKDE